MAAISIAVASQNRTNRFVINDLNAPLVKLLQEAIENPEQLINDYEQVWKEQFSYGENHVQHYYLVRERFNDGEETPANTLYLLARCVKGSVRYGKNGKFNQGPDKRRHGTSPQTLMNNVYALSQLLKGKSVFYALDYHSILDMAEPGDIVYMDPPYQGVSNVRDNRYLSGVLFDDFVKAVEKLDSRKINYLISYDGKCGDKTYGKDLPRCLHCKKIMLKAGLSSQAILLGQKSITLEALYVSNDLLHISNRQLELFSFGDAINE